jgi:multisubunit Na+/H+ antiporter MnhC subunit
MAQFEKRLVCEHAGIDDRFAGRAAWLPILIIGPFVILLFCASPHSDDICFAATWRDVGLIAMVRSLYLTFQGRIFSFVAAIVPFWIHGTLGGDLLADFRAFCAAALGATLALALWAGNALLPTSSRSIRLFSGLMLAAVLVAGSPQPEDMIYWATGIGFYTIPSLFCLGMMIWLYRQAVRMKPLGPLAVTLLAAGGMLIATATEISGPVLLAIVVGAFLQRWLLADAPRQPLAHALILGAIAIGIAIVLLSPGNAIRMRTIGTDQGIGLRALTGLPMAVAHVAQFLVRRLTNPALLAWLICLLCVAPRADRGPRQMPARGALTVWWPLVTTMITIYGALWIGHVATGKLLEQRALNFLHFVLVGGLSLTAIAASAAYGGRIWGMIEARWPRFDPAKLAVAGLLLMLATPHFLQAVRILPHVEALYRQAQERFAQLGDGKIPGAPIADRTLVLPASTTGDIPWFADPVSADPDAWTNGCVARYAGVRSVAIAPPAASN